MELQELAGYINWFSVAMFYVMFAITVFSWVAALKWRKLVKEYDEFSDDVLATNSKLASELESSMRELFAYEELYEDLIFAFQKYAGLYKELHHYWKHRHWPYGERISQLREQKQALQHEKDDLLATWEGHESALYKHIDKLKAEKSAMRYSQMILQEKTMELFLLLCKGLMSDMVVNGEADFYLPVRFDQLAPAEGQVTGMENYVP